MDNRSPTRRTNENTLSTKRSKYTKGIRKNNQPRDSNPRKENMREENMARNKNNHNRK